MANANPFRFSTKYQDDETGLLYYGYRYLESGTRRWIQLDPTEEEGGLNLYSLDGNDLVNGKDILGLFKVSKNCNAKELASLRAAESAASATASSALSSLQTQFKVKQLLSKYPNFKAKWLNDLSFRSAYKAWYHWTESSLQEIVAGFAANSYGVQCECNCWERPKSTWAYVDDPTSWFPYDGIHFCPLFFKDTKQNQVKHFLHEASHLFADTYDLQLGGYRPWVENANDAYWYGNMGLIGGQEVFDSFIRGISVGYP